MSNPKQEAAKKREKTNLENQAKRKTASQARNEAKNRKPSENSDKAILFIEI